MHSLISSVVGIFAPYVVIQDAFSFTFFVQHRTFVFEIIGVQLRLTASFKIFARGRNTLRKVLPAAVGFVWLFFLLLQTMSWQSFYILVRLLNWALLLIGIVRIVIIIWVEPGSMEFFFFVVLMDWHHLRSNLISIEITITVTVTLIKSTILYSIVGRAIQFFLLPEDWIFIIYVLILILGSPRRMIVIFFLIVGLFNSILLFFWIQCSYFIEGFIFLRVFSRRIIIPIAVFLFRGRDKLFPSVIIGNAVHFRSVDIVIRSILNLRFLFFLVHLITSILDVDGNNYDPYYPPNYKQGSSDGPNDQYLGGGISIISPAATVFFHLDEIGEVVAEDCYGAQHADALQDVQEGTGFGTHHSV